VGVRLLLGVDHVLLEFVRVVFAELPVPLHHENGEDDGGDGNDQSDGDRPSLAELIDGVDGVVGALEFWISVGEKQQRGAKVRRHREAPTGPS